ncbi:MAG TPA: rRNA adenine dimethyltransferase family protein, partial [Thermodesulfobacteriota bacterium]|nr:rRNA adenine dimethyltransferase family protein [Thermodesulfobacteriota bacterium]
MDSPRRQLRNLRIRPRKRLGQHFLHDPNILRKIVDSASLTGEDTVVEIGAGLGSLTGFLAERAGRVVALEIDPRLATSLRESYDGSNRVEIVNDDALRFDFAALFHGSGRKLKLVANLPY